MGPKEQSITTSKKPEDIKIYDCFMYFNELELLKFRLEYCYNYVTKFIIIDATETHTGAPKAPLNLDLIDAKFRDKIIYECIDFPAELSIKNNTKNVEKIAWEREHYQRNRIANYLKKFEEDDLCLISDLDEICNYKVLLKYLEEYHLFYKLVHHVNPTYVYNIHFLQSDYWHACSFTAPIKLLLNKNISYIRFGKKKFIDGKAQYITTPFKENDITSLYHYENMTCFIHLNQFSSPIALHRKHCAISEGIANANSYETFNIELLRRHVKAILTCNLENLIEVNHTFPNILYKHLHKIHTMKPKALKELWDEVKDMSDNELLIWNQNMFGDA